jgi:hypothetical protein
MAISDTPPARVQFVVSGKFIALLLLGAGLLGGGYYWYSEQQQAQKRFHTPPYFINRGATISRPCNRCLALDKLKAQSEWSVGSPVEIPSTEQRWFLAAEDPPTPVVVSGVLMLPVYPTLRDNPAFGFDQTRVLLVLYQNLQRMGSIEPLPSPPQPPVAAPPAQPPPSDPPPETSAQSPFLGNWENEDPATRSVTRFSIVSDADKLVVHAWGKCQPTDCDWREVGANVTDGGMSVVWDFETITKIWKLSQESDGRLKLSEHSHYTDGRTDRDETSLFIRSPEGQQ